MKKKSLQFAVVLGVSVVLFLSAYHSMSLANGWIAVIVIGLAALPFLLSRLFRIPIKQQIPDMVFGAIDTGLLTIPALIGGSMFGVLGAILGGIIGDAVTDAIAGFFEGSIAEWFRKKGIVESREALSSSLGKMSGCLMGSGFVLLLAVIVGVDIKHIFYEV